MNDVDLHSEGFHLHFDGRRDVHRQRHRYGRSL